MQATVVTVAVTRVVKGVRNIAGSGGSTHGTNLDLAFHLEIVRGTRTLIVALIAILVTIVAVLVPDNRGHALELAIVAILVTLIGILVILGCLARMTALVTIGIAKD